MLPTNPIFLTSFQSNLNISIRRHSYDPCKSVIILRRPLGRGTVQLCPLKYIDIEFRDNDGNC